MCGIAGIISLKEKVPDKRSRLIRMAQLLSHRGPDGEGFFYDSRFAVFNNRLSITGVLDTPSLPLSSPDGRYVLSFNGELYNYKKIKQYLITKGLHFKTNTDTEVLLNGLIYQGLDFLKLIDGVWAFAFFDTLTARAYLSRDLVGEKPLYYHSEASEIIFASEVPPIIAAMRESPMWSPSAVVSSVSHRAAASGSTLFQNVKRLRGGECLCIDFNYPNCNIKSIFPLKIKANKHHSFFVTSPCFSEVRELYEQEIETSCRSRFPGEVDFVSSLSGGIDSTLINLFLSDFGSKKISSLHGSSTIQSPASGGDLSEIDAARYTADRLNINLFNFNLYEDFDSRSIHEHVASNSFDGILCEGVASFQLLAKRAKDLGAKVLVLSDGPDELLNGYNSDRHLLKVSSRLSDVSIDKRNRIHSAVMRRVSWDNKSQALLNWHAQVGDENILRPNHAGTTPDILKMIFSEEVLNSSGHTSFGTISNDIFDPESLHGLDASQLNSIRYVGSSLPDYVNTRSDRATMSEGIEARLPFLSLSLIELFLSTPSCYRIRKNDGKVILRSIVDKYIGSHISKRKKYGFAAPINKNNSYGAYEKMNMRDVIFSSDFFDRGSFFNDNAREKMMSAQNGRLIWMAYCFALTNQKLKEIRCS